MSRSNTCEKGKKQKLCFLAHILLAVVMEINCRAVETECVLHCVRLLRTLGF